MPSSLPLADYPRTLKQLVSAVQRLRGWVGTDPARTPELADGLVQLTEVRLLAGAFAEATEDAQESLVLAGKVLASHGPLGPYTPEPDALRFLTAAAQLAHLQASLGHAEAAGGTIATAVAVREQLSHLALDAGLDAAARLRASLALAAAALATGDVGAANARADAALVELVSARLDADPDAALLAVEVERTVSDARWAAGRTAAAVAWSRRARQRFDALVAGRFAARPAPAVLERLAAPLPGVYTDLADRLAGSGDRAQALQARRELVATLESLGLPADAATNALASDLVRDGRPDEAAALGVEPSHELPTPRAPVPSWTGLTAADPFVLAPTGDYATHLDQQIVAESQSVDATAARVREDALAAAFRAEQGQRAAAAAEAARVAAEAAAAEAARAAAAEAEAEREAEAQRLAAAQAEREQTKRRRAERIEEYQRELERREAEKAETDP